MKIRTSFVANSSSSSFVLVGQRITFKDVTEELMEEEDVYCFGGNIGEGRDIFRVTKEHLDFLKKHLKLLEFEGGFDFFICIATGEEEIELTPEMLKGRKKIVVVPEEIDQHSSWDAKDLPMNYEYQLQQMEDEDEDSTSFVANSSTTSFCIAGVQLEERISNERYTLLDMAGLYLAWPPEGYTTYVGLDIDRMKDDETLREFKNRALSLLQANGIAVPEVFILTDGWYDG